MMLTAPPDFLAAETAPSLAALFRGDATAVSQVTLDMTGDGEAERVVLVGRRGPTGALFPVGLVVLKGTAAPLQVLGAAALSLNHAYDGRLGSPFSKTVGADDESDSPAAVDGAPVLAAYPEQPDDLDGNGRNELVLYSRARGPQLVADGATWWQLEGDDLRPIYHLQSEWKTRQRTERRVMTWVRAGVLDEEVVTVHVDGHQAKRTVRLSYDPAIGRFGAARPSGTRATLP